MATLVLAAIMLWTACYPSEAVTTLPAVQADGDMGILVLSFAWGTQSEGNATAYELRVFLRASCAKSSSTVRLRGFAGAFPIEESGPAGIFPVSPHFQPPVRHHFNLSVVSPATNQTLHIPWVGPSNNGLWRFEGTLQPVGGELLVVEGSNHAHLLVLSCFRPLAGTLPHCQQFPLTGVWNVVTTLSANNMAPETLAYLLQQHLHYHERLGFNGTILRCNKGEAQALSVMPQIEKLVASRKLLVWPWVRLLFQLVTVCGCCLRACSV